MIEKEKDEFKYVGEYASSDAVLFIWSTNAHLQDALLVMESWRFEYKTNIAWVKDRAITGNLGFYLSGQHELLLIGAKGSFLPDIKPSSVVEAKKSGHSRKPEIFYEIIESMYPDVKRAEIFARNKREGWDSYGNEIRVE